MPLHCAFHSPSPAFLPSLLLLPLSFIETYQVRNLDLGHRTHRKEENTDATEGSAGDGRTFLILVSTFSSAF